MFIAFNFLFFVLFTFLFLVLVLISHRESLRVIRYSLKLDCLARGNLEYIINFNSNKYFIDGRIGKRLLKKQKPKWVCNVSLADDVFPIPR